MISKLPYLLIVSPPQLDIQSCFRFEIDVVQSSAFQLLRLNLTLVFFLRLLQA